MICLTCSNPFEAKRKSAKYCSSKCRKLAFQNNVVSVPETTPAIVSVPQAWRSVTTHPKGGYYVEPGVCKFGECLDPKCRFRSGL